MENIRSGIVIKGIPSSSGIVFGKAVLFKSDDIAIPSNLISKDDVENEIIRFDSAITELKSEFFESIKKFQSEDSNIVAILEANMMIITDSMMIDSVIKKIKNRAPAEVAIIQEYDERMQYFKNTKDRTLRERAFELEHLKERFLDVLRHKSLNYGLVKDSILIIRSLTTVDFMRFKEAGMIGLVTEMGGIASHTSILARSYNLPAVIGVKNVVKLIEPDSDIILDGYSGLVISNPIEEQLDEYRNKKKQHQEQRIKLGELAKLASDTLDGRHVTIMSNIDSLDEIDTSILNGAEGFGLVRTEHFIESSRHFPDENTQYLWYRDLADRAYPRVVTIRAFDIGSDKHAEGLPMHENNPALGFRGIRFLLSRIDVFEAQIKSVLRASRNKNIRFMLPMITSSEELDLCITIIEKCKAEFYEKNVTIDYRIPVGVMIETPSAALIADELALKSDFFSIGTNDLTQYTLAVDRENDLVSNIFNSFHPSILRLMKSTIDAANSHNIPVSVCGEMAGHAAATSLFIGMGVHELSVAPSILPELKSRIRQLAYTNCIKFAHDILKLKSQDEIKIKLNLA